MSGHTLLVALRLAVVAAGALAGLWCLRLALDSRTHRGVYLLLAFGFGFVAGGAVIEGALFEFAAWSLADAHTAEGLVQALGFGLVLAAILRSRE